MIQMFDRQRTLEELEEQIWEKPEHPSSIVLACHALRKKAINTFTNEELRLMIVQAIGLDYLIPMAMERLQADPMASGDLYPGDLKKAVTTVNRDFWDRHLGLKIAYLQLIK